MAANSYYASTSLSAHEQQQQHLLSPALSSPGYSSGQSSGPATPLKPLHLVTGMDTHYNPHSFDQMDTIKSAQHEDERLKSRIRRLRLLSRIIAFLISIGVFIPITLTIHKFTSTQHIYHDVMLPNGTIQNRTAWAKDTKAWPSWMYFAVAGVSVVLNLIIILSYVFGSIAHANRAALIATTFSWIVMFGNLVVWGVAASLYRTEKDKNGKSNDLWGWTCSPAAKKIQETFANEVNFNSYCNIQSISWYIGLVQVAAAVLTIITYILVLIRRNTKKKINRHTQLYSAGVH